MQVRIRTKNLEISEAIRGATERTVRLGLGRHAAGIEIARVTLSPAPVVHGDAALRCRIVIRGRQTGRLTIEELANDIHTAASSAARRIEQRLERQRIARPAGDFGARRGGRR